MKPTKISAIMGLTALLNGCDENQQRELAACDVGGLQARAVYQERYDELDHITLNFYKDNKLVASVQPYLRGGVTKSWIQCDDGRRLHFESGNQKVYFSSEKK